MRRRSCLLSVIALVASCLCASAEGVRYNRDVRPILSDNCFRCHGADKGSRKAKLRLDEREVALDRGAIVPGKPDESEIVKRIYATNEDDVMPPPDTHKQLSAAQKETLKRWIAEGGAYEPHWSFIPPVRPAVPAAKGGNAVDAFVRAELEKKQIKPSPEADRRTLLRRLSLDLTGLPPTPSEVDTFERDRAPGAYERQVERLLASSHYGERMAVPWLDVVRFADTVGYHGDQNVNVFPYRDYVINAFNGNKRFDQFTIEQLAGDLLPNATVEQRVATGFNRLNMVTREGGAQPKEYLAKYGADRVRTVGMAWLGLTVGCAECHDHKFDPFTTKDFYQLKAFFADVRQWGVYSDYKYTPNPDLKGWDNDHPFPPEEVVESPYLKQRMQRIQAQMQEVAKSVAETNSAAFAVWRAELQSQVERARTTSLPTPLRAVTTNFAVLTNSVKVTNALVVAGSAKHVTNVATVASFKTNKVVMTNFTVQADGSLLFAGTKADGLPLSFGLHEGRVTSINLELLPHEKHKGSVFRGTRGAQTIQLSAALKRKDGKETKLAFYFADSEVKEPRYANGFDILGIKDAWKIPAERSKEKLVGTWLIDPPIQAAEGDTLVVTFKTNTIGCLRVTTWPFATPVVSGTPLDWLASTAADANAFARYKTLHRELQECRGGKSPSVVTVAWKPEVTRVLPRGNWQSDDGEVVQPLPPHFLPQAKQTDTNRLTRLDLARWLVSPENPLTTRTVVNRLWKQFFGSGLANPVDDLGLQGEPPSHPELLDWLAVEFRESGWDVKHIVRLIVSSATYRQSSRLRPELRDIDPNNRLLASQNPRRLEAEFVRDNALAIAGLINLDIGGPSAHPYQPAGYYVNLQFPDRDYYADKDERQYRRGLYSHWQRTFLQPMMANFDAPSREECTAIRTVSNTPQQALTLLNDPTFVESARVLAARVLREQARSDDERLDRIFRLALGRPIKSTERESLKRFLAGQREHLLADKDEPVKLQKVGFAPAAADKEATELGAWTSVCRVVLNLHETITIY